MARKLIKRYLPDARKIRDHKHLQIFGTLLHDPNLWHLNRHSVSTGFGIGMFLAFMPIPFQMVAAAAAAILLRANLPISVALVWISNPLTMPPIFYFSYKVGTWVLRIPPQEVAFELSWPWLTTGLAAVWQPFLLGCLLVGTVSSAAGYFLMRSFWRWQVLREWERRKDERREKRRRQRT